MKRVLILGLLVLAVVMPALAADKAVTVGGWGRYGFIIDTSTSPATVKDAEYSRVYLTYNVDDYTTAVVQFFNTVNSQSKDIPYYYYGYLQSDIAGATGLSNMGLGLTLWMGKYLHADSNFDSTTAYGQSEGAAQVGAPSWLIATTVSMAGLNLEAGIIPIASNDFYVSLNTTQSGSWGKANVEFSFDGNAADTPGEGFISSTANYSIALGSITPQFGFGFKDDLKTKAMEYNGAVKVTYGTLGNAAAKLVLNNDGLENFYFSAQGGPFNAGMVPVTLLAAAKMDLTASPNGGETFQAAELAVKCHVGAADIYTGYLITSVGGSVIWAPATTTNGGPYIKMEFSF